MRITLVPEKYGASPVTISIPMSQEDEQKLMNAARPIQTVQGLISIFKTIVGEQ